MFKQFSRITKKAGMLTLTIGVLVFTVVFAASGDLDTTFNGNGLATNPMIPLEPDRLDIGQKVAIQPDESIVIAGNSNQPDIASYDFAVTRYTKDGVLDTSFDNDGLLITEFGGVVEAYDVAIQPADSKIIVAGKKCINGGTNCDVVLTRYNPDGSLDNTFSNDGKQKTDFNSRDNGTLGGIAIQSNGRIVVAGYMWNGGDYDFAVYRYLANGNLDKTFSGDGRVNIGIAAGRQDFASDVAIQSDGKIVVAGYTGKPNFKKNKFAVVRLNSNGTLDKTFSGDGKLTTSFGADDYALGIALQPNGRIVVAGYSYDGLLNYMALTRYKSNGALDTSFNVTGKLKFSVVPGLDSQAKDVVVQSDEKIVVAGETNNISNYDFAVVRLNSGGDFDTSFSGDGIATVDFGADDYGRGLAVQPDGSYVVAGFINDGTQWDVAVGRVLP